MTPTTREKIIDLRCTGYSDQHVAKFCGVTVHEVRSEFRKHVMWREKLKRVSV